MPTTASLPAVDVRSDLSPAEFYADYVNQKPVLMSGRLSHLPATSRWSLAHLASLVPDLEVRLKTGDVAQGVTTTVRLEEYCRTVEEWEEKVAVFGDVGPPPAYMHDVPLISLIPQLRYDLEPFPTELFPKLFRDQWWVFPQFFVGPSRAVTPLHFDTLLTHNLFFQFEGRKRFVMVDTTDRPRCYTYNWRWAKVDVDAPDYERFPLFQGVKMKGCLVEAGDLLYIPPGTLHQVTSLTPSVSFNIDWHDRVSALRGLTAIRQGMPLQNLRYNVLFALGVWCRVPLRVLMPALRSYFVYIS